jgi:hypothetical protein
LKGIWLIQARLNSELFDLTKNHVDISGYDGDMMRIEWQYLYIYIQNGVQQLCDEQWIWDGNYGFYILFWHF